MKTRFGQATRECLSPLPVIQKRSVMYVLVRVVQRSGYYLPQEGLALGRALEEKLKEGA